MDQVLSRALIGTCGPKLSAREARALKPLPKPPLEPEEEAATPRDAAAPASRGKAARKQAPKTPRKTARGNGEDKATLVTPAKPVKPVKRAPGKTATRRKTAKAPARRGRPAASEGN